MLTHTKKKNDRFSIPTNANILNSLQSKLESLANDVQRSSEDLKRRISLQEKREAEFAIHQNQMNMQHDAELQSMKEKYVSVMNEKLAEKVRLENELLVRNEQTAQLEIKIKILEARLANLSDNAHLSENSAKRNKRSEQITEVMETPLSHRYQHTGTLVEKISKLQEELKHASITEEKLMHACRYYRSQLIKLTEQHHLLKQHIQVNNQHDATNIWDRNRICQEKHHALGDTLNDSSTSAKPSHLSPYQTEISYLWRSIDLLRQSVISDGMSPDFSERPPSSTPRNARRGNKKLILKRVKNSGKSEDHTLPISHLNLTPPSQSIDKGSRDESNSSNNIEKNLLTQVEFSESSSNIAELASLERNRQSMMREDFECSLPPNRRKWENLSSDISLSSHDTYISGINDQGKYDIDDHLYSRKLPTKSELSPEIEHLNPTKESQTYSDSSFSSFCSSSNQLCKKEDVSYKSLNKKTDRSHLTNDEFEISREHSHSRRNSHKRWKDNETPTHRSIASSSLFHARESAVQSKDRRPYEKPLSRLLPDSYGRPKSPLSSPEINHITTTSQNNSSRNQLSGNRSFSTSVNSKLPLMQLDISEFVKSIQENRDKLLQTGVYDNESKIIAEMNDKIHFFDAYLTHTTS